MIPSDICILEPCPLTNVFGKLEAEQAAALLISVLAAGADEWGTVTPPQVGAFIREHLESESGNPVTWIKDEGRKRPLRFTENGLLALRESRWNCAK